MNKTDLKASKKTKIDSPLAKYNAAGQLFCVLCNQQVKHEMVWTAHINGRAHRENIQQLKAKKRPQEASSEHSSPPSKKQALDKAGPSHNSVKDAKEFEFQAPLPVTSSEFKAPAAVPTRNVKEKPHPTTSSKNTTVATILKITTSRALEIRNVVDNGDDQNGMEVDVQGSSISNATNSKSSSSNGVSNLPEGFFDDPKLDAKARGLEYRDPEEIEWDNFVKEIASEEVKSSTMRVVDEEESTVTRELDEIEEQMAQWQRVLDLEKKAKDLKGVKSQAPKKTTEDEEMDEDEEYDEELDWRSKRH